MAGGEGDETAARQPAGLEGCQGWWFLGLGETSEGNGRFGGVNADSGEIYWDVVRVSFSLSFDDI